MFVDLKNLPNCCTCTMYTPGGIPLVKLHLVIRPLFYLVIRSFTCDEEWKCNSHDKYKKTSKIEQLTIHG